jgi:hypothetical protein
MLLWNDDTIARLKLTTKYQVLIANYGPNS